MTIMNIYLYVRVRMFFFFWNNVCYFF